MGDILQLELKQYIQQENKGVTSTWIAREYQISINEAVREIEQYCKDNRNDVKVGYLIVGIDKDGGDVIINVHEDKCKDTEKKLKTISSKTVYSIQSKDHQGFSQLKQSNKAQLENRFKQVLECAKQQYEAHGRGNVTMSDAEAQRSAQQLQQTIQQKLKNGQSQIDYTPRIGKGQNHLPKQQEGAKMQVEGAQVFVEGAKASAEGVKVSAEGIGGAKDVKAKKDLNQQEQIVKNENLKDKQGDEQKVDKDKLKIKQEGENKSKDTQDNDNKSSLNATKRKAAPSSIQSMFTKKQNSSLNNSNQQPQQFNNDQITKDQNNDNNNNNNKNKGNNYYDDNKSKQVNIKKEESKQGAVSIDEPIEYLQSLDNNNSNSNNNDNSDKNNHGDPTHSKNHSKKGRLKKGQDNQAKHNNKLNIKNHNNNDSENYDQPNDVSNNDNNKSNNNNNNNKSRGMSTLETRSIQQDQILNDSDFEDDDSMNIQAPESDGDQKYKSQQKPKGNIIKGKQKNNNDSNPNSTAENPSKEGNTKRRQVLQESDNDGENDMEPEQNNQYKKQSGSSDIQNRKEKVTSKNGETKQGIKGEPGDTNKASQQVVKGQEMEATSVEDIIKELEVLDKEATYNIERNSQYSRVEMLDDGSEKIEQYTHKKLIEHYQVLKYGKILKTNLNNSDHGTQYQAQNGKGNQTNKNLKQATNSTKQTTQTETSQQTTQKGKQTKKAKQEELAKPSKGIKSFFGKK